MHSAVDISFKKLTKKATVSIPASKSEANRALILSALKSGISEVKNLPKASDTRILIDALSTDEGEINIADAGTSFRFLTAYFVATQESKVLIGTERMYQRPIGDLVDCLGQLGGAIEYLGEEGFPPLSIEGVKLNHNGVVELKGNISSQFISALMLVAPVLKNGLKIKLLGNLVSQPYIELTRNVLSQFGVNSSFSKDEIIIAEQQIQDVDYMVGGDWSSVSYWMAMVSLADNYTVVITGLDKDSAQGDKKVIEIMDPLGVKCI